MFELDSRVAEIANQPSERESLIQQYKPFILKCASDCAKQYIADTDDEWSIALLAFSEAIDKYQQAEGHFLSFAKLVIWRRLYDYFGANQKYNREIPVAPSVFSGEVQDDEMLTDIHLQVRDSLITAVKTDITDEIEAVNALFSAYGFTFFELAACSPKAEKTKAACTKVIVYLLKNSILTNELRKTRQLSIKLLEEKTQVPRKILERHRKYIIAVVELLSGEYPCLTDYLRPIREELNK
ncbi:MAG: sigma factor [Ruthenibacterium sp.]